MATVTTAMERIIRIPEMLDIIFSHNHCSQNARCARVSRSWSDVALNHVWRERPPLKALFQLLAPLVPSNNMPQTETLPEDWIKFFALATRVREFVLSSRETDLLADSVITEVSLTRPAVSILPNLEDFSVCGRLTARQIHYSCLFLRGSITSFSFTIQDHPPMAEEVQSLLSLVLRRSPNLKVFNLILEELRVKKIETDLCLLLSRLRHLESLCFCPALLSVPVLSSIASLPNLINVDIAPLSFSLEEHLVDSPLPDTDYAFRSLTSLTMQGSFKSVTRLFSPRVFPLKLHTLTIEIIDENQTSEFRPCLEALANACPRLKKLEFLMCGSGLESHDSGPITAQDLSPLMSFPLLETFELRYDNAVSMSDEELIHIVKRCPSLRHLDLNYVPLSASTESTSLTLGFLALLVKESATVKLERLSIFVNALSTVGPPEVEGYLENLRRISFGVSPIREPSNEVVLYLSQLVPSTCEFYLGDRLDDIWDDDGETSGRWSIWEDIGRMLPLLREARLDERRRKNKRIESGGTVVLVHYRGLLTTPTEALVYAWAMERIIDIPEVLDVIFSYNSLSDNARCARASRAWSDIALDHVWRIDPPVMVLFQLLAPLVPSERSGRVDDPGLVFSRAVGPDDWQRFNNCARRVKELNINAIIFRPDTAVDGTIADSVFAEVSATRTAVSILPNLQNLTFFGNLSDSRLRCILLFLHKPICSLSFYLGDHPHTTIRNARLLFEEVLRHTPDITRLDLSLARDDGSTEEDICFLLNGLKHLENLNLPPYNLTTTVLHSVARLPILKHIHTLLYGNHHVKVGIDLQLPDNDNAFMSLQSLGLRTDLDTITHLFPSRIFSSGIRTLTVDIVSEDLASDFRQCLEVLANSCPGLKKLKLYTPHNPSTSYDFETVTARNLTLLTSFLLLEEFELRSNAAFSVSDDELVDIIKECPSLRRLKLNSAFFSDPPTSLTLNFLALLASEPMGAKLEHLEIYLNALTAFDLPVVEGRLENLHTISSGTSPVSASDNGIPLYLSRLIPATCRFNVHSMFDELIGYVRPEEDDDVLDRRAVWREIRSSLALLADVH
ncbi:hypothetical protein M0805_000069 [Coniferiporia weirii]|nr:hypothetical protein M0805_000069 [Coniferiporia weirii]